MAIDKDFFMVVFSVDFSQFFSYLSVMDLRDLVQFLVLNRESSNVINMLDNIFDFYQ